LNVNEQRLDSSANRTRRVDGSNALPSAPSIVKSIHARPSFVRSTSSSARTEAIEEKTEGRPAGNGSGGNGQRKADARPAEHPVAGSTGPEDFNRNAQAYVRAIIEAVPPFLVLDPALRVVTANESFYSHFHVTPPQTEMSPVYALGNGQWNIPELRVFLEEILPKNKSFKDFEVCHEFQAIGRRTILLSGHQVDHLQLILLLVNDITKQREAEASMRFSEMRFRRLFEAAQDGILMLDPATRKITDANPFMTELLDYPHEELVGKELWEIGLLKDQESSRGAFRELQANHFIRYEDLPLQTKTGKCHDVEFVSNLYEESGREVIQCNIRDITRRKHEEETLLAAHQVIRGHATELEEVVAQRTSQLKETIGELEAFSYSVSHDMRAPLRAMQGYAQLVSEGYTSKPLDAVGNEFLQRISRAADRLDQLIQDVLSYTRVLRADSPMVTVDLDRLTRDIIETQPKGDHGAEIEIEGTLPPVLGNQALLTQCLSNLLTNAVKFVSPGTVPRVRIWAEEANLTGTEQQNKNEIPPVPSPAAPNVPSEGGLPAVKVFVEDNGIGIDAKDHARVFRMFERVHAAAEFEGTGIGLTIVRKAAGRMGAELGFESEPGKGTRFWILLPKG